MLKLSDEAGGAVMMALQKSLMEQSDITGVLKEFEIQIDDSDELVIMNPPMIETQSNEKVDIETSVQ